MVKKVRQISGKAAHSTGLILGLEGGGTKTTWALIDSSSQRILKQGKAGAGNVQLMNDASLKKLFLQIRRETGNKLIAVGGAFAGCQLPSEQKRVEKVMRDVWPQAQSFWAGEDSRSALAAGFGNAPGIIVIAGTGSNVVGQKELGGALEKVVGWGHLFADRGSSYDLSRRAMEKIFFIYDTQEKVSVLGHEFLRATRQRSLEEMVPFLLSDSSKAFIASWAECVFKAAEKGDRDAQFLLKDGAEFLAQSVVLVARRLRLKTPGVALVGGLFEKQPGYIALFKRALKKEMSSAEVFLLETPGVVGAARMVGLSRASGVQRSESEPENTSELRLPPTPVSGDPARLAAYAQASTEQRNPRSRGLDQRPIIELVDLFIEEERYVETALRAQRKQLAQATELVVEKLLKGGRLFYVGAGTSGRLGVVDASEMPPTFNASPEQIQALIAGGSAAVFHSQEGAEDDRLAAAKELQERGLQAQDVVCGIAASGQTPYVLGALEFATRVGAATILISCNPARSLRVPVQIEIDLPTGPEIVTGSTRLKAGTATKLVLNILSTIANIKLGRVRDNLMINVQATNDKLRARAVRLVQELAKCDAATAQEGLRQKNWSVVDTVKLLESPDISV